MFNAPYYQSSEFHQGKTYIFQDSSKEVLIEALSNQKKIPIDFQIKISKILLKMAKINCPICQEVSAFPFATIDKGKAFRYTQFFFISNSL